MSGCGERFADNKSLFFIKQLLRETIESGSFYRGIQMLRTLTVHCSFISINNISYFARNIRVFFNRK